MNILDIINTLKNAPRQGAVSDEPEGMRYILMSDTLANIITKSLEEFLRDKQPLRTDESGRVTDEYIQWCQRNHKDPFPNWGNDGNGRG